MVTIVLTVSRHEYLEKVITALELLECNQSDTNLLCIVDGDNELFVKTRNLVMDTKFKERLTVKLDCSGSLSKYFISERRRRISAAHNQARSLIRSKSHDFVFSVEDDTIVPPNALSLLLKVQSRHRAAAFVEGVELGRWGVPYVGAWRVDGDIYKPEKLVSVENIFPVPEGQPEERIDAGGLYCALIRADVYKNHTFHSENGLGPDINLGLELRQLGYENFLVWNVPCRHFCQKNGVDITISPATPSKIVTLTKKNDRKWSESYE